MFNRAWKYSFIVDHVDSSYQDSTIIKDLLSETKYTEMGYQSNMTYYYVGKLIGHKKQFKALKASNPVTRTV